MEHAAIGGSHIRARKGRNRTGSGLEEDLGESPANRCTLVSRNDRFRDTPWPSVSAKVRRVAQPVPENNVSPRGGGTVCATLPGVAKIGYARVSARDQSPDSQIDALKAPA